MESESENADWDVVVVGSGGAGCAAAIEAKQAGARVLMITKSSLLDSKTARAQGGIQAAVGDGDSPERHFEDTWKAGKEMGNEALVRILSERAPETVKWLEEMGVAFDRDESGYRLMSAAGLSHPRVLTCGDTAGRGIAEAVLRRVEALNIPIWHETGLTDLASVPRGFRLTLKQQGRVSDPTLLTRTVVLATGGAMPEERSAGLVEEGLANMPDGLDLAARLGARVVMPDLVQYHPTGILLPKALRRKRLPETMRGAGARFLNREGEAFVDPLLTRNDLTQAIIEECQKGLGVETDDGRQGVWLDTPRIDQVKGAGYLREHFPTFHALFLEHGNDLTV
ncbi:MAG: FAD-dependent oxidoreductase, partial [Verrucomicrobiae bacterium]|nr:FAD-dependent oxidoreductase [Verrucomicrobiae bacterium]